MIEKYFKLFKGQEVRYSEIRKVAAPAVEVLIFDRKLVAQTMLWEHDEMIQPSKDIVNSDLPDA